MRLESLATKRRRGEAPKKAEHPRTGSRITLRVLRCAAPDIQSAHMVSTLSGPVYRPQMLRPRRNADAPFPEHFRHRQVCSTEEKVVAR